MRRVVGLAVLAALWGCVPAAPIAVAPVVQATGVNQRFDAAALVLVTEDERQWQSSSGPTGLIGSAIDLQLPLGRVMEEAASDLYGKAFRSARLIRSPADAPAGSLVIHPKVESFSWSGGFTGDTAVVATAVVVMIDGKEILRRVYTRQEAAPLGMVSGSNLGPAAAKGIVGALVQSLDDMRASTEVQAWVDTEGGSSAARRMARRSGPKGSAGFPRAKLKLDFPQAPENPDDVAVIIGNANYGQFNSDIPNVDPAYADTEAMMRYAVQALGVREGNVIYLQDATGAQMTRIFGSDKDFKGQLYDWVRPGRSRVFVYYAGHGAPAGADGSPYLVPADADAARIELNGYPLATLYRNLAQLQARETTVVIEACFSGVSQAGAVLPRASGIYVKPRTAQVPSTVTVIAAGHSDQVASWEEDKSNGLFTKYYLTGMAGAADKGRYGNGDGRVDLAELKAYLADTLTYYARRYYGRDQTPEIVAGGRVMN